jgi:hypothetical protein
MEPTTRDRNSTDKDTDPENLYSMMEASMKGNGSKIKCMEPAHYSTTLKNQPIKANGFKINSQEKEFFTTKVLEKLKCV